MTEPRTVTLPTIDHGPVTLTCPAWCRGHADHRPDTHRSDILHIGPAVTLTFHGAEVVIACIVQAPCATIDTPGLGGRTPGISMDPPARTLTPVDVYSFAAALDGYADRIRDLADQLDAILAGGHQ
ncbi:hypothetical protein [Streptomyces sp. ATCC 21386]|uniref:DUF6907 domain-containing protein n=1 Tax=Streptomyces sp. ATCC 21386 TaxID=2699428 RepID=UPI001BFF1FA5|nr:hypothetical protein [Streptomyces sp. ATCC 21386]